MSPSFRNKNPLFPFQNSLAEIIFKATHHFSSETPNPIQTEPDPDPDVPLFLVASLELLSDQCRTEGDIIELSYSRIRL